MSVTLLQFVHPAREKSRVNRYLLNQAAALSAVRVLLDDSERGQESLQVQTQVQLGRCLAPTVLGPVHAVGIQSNS